MTDHTPAPVQAAPPAVNYPDRPIVARAGTYYRYARFALFLLFMSFGAWCCYDGFYKYPSMNAEDIKLGRPQRHGPPNATWDVHFNVALGCVLPIGAVVLLIWTLHNSRGEYRLQGTTLQAPGHPPIQLDSIRRIDKRLWDKKGIAFIEYERPSAPDLGRFKLDDFVYQREPIDKILETIEAHALSMAQAAPASPAAPPQN